MNKRLMLSLIIIVKVGNRIVSYFIIFALGYAKVIVKGRFGLRKITLFMFSLVRESTDLSFGLVHIQSLMGCKFARKILFYIIFRSYFYSIERCI